MLCLISDGITTYMYSHASESQVTCGMGKFLLLDKIPVSAIHFKRSVAYPISGGLLEDQSPSE